MYKPLDHSPDVDKIIDKSDNSPIRTACQIGYSRTILRRMLEGSKAWGTDLVREACRQGNKNHEALLELLKTGLDPNGLSRRGETSLMSAAYSGSIGMVGSLLFHESDAKATDYDGITVAHYACAPCHPKRRVCSEKQRYRVKRQSKFESRRSHSAPPRSLS